MTIKAYVFDAYGTVFDVHSAVQKQADRLGKSGQNLSDTWRSKQLEYAWVRSLMGSYSDFWTLTQDALDYAMAVHKIADVDLRHALLEAYWNLDCYTEVPSVLAGLRDQGVRTAILTNGSTDMIHAAVENAGLDRAFDALFCGDAVKIFKTSPQVYQMVCDSWDVTPSEVCLVSANRWDVAGASKFGFETVWVNRSGQPDEYRKYTPSRVIGDLSAL